MRLIRVFPDRTSATPDDELVAVNRFPTILDEADEVHVSVTFTWHLKFAERLATAWKYVAPVKMGGPACGDRGDEFVPGRYLKKGDVITSRGCIRKCPYCFVPKREGSLRLLKIQDGWNIRDNNLLACPDEHVKAVFAMCSRQKEKIEFSGGFEARLLRQWHVDELVKLRVYQMFFAYDKPADLEPLIEAGKKFYAAGLKRYANGRPAFPLRAYVLIGYKDDTFTKAEKRLKDTIAAGFYPYTMLYRDETGKCNPDWREFQYYWGNPKFAGEHCGFINQRIQPTDKLEV